MAYPDAVFESRPNERVSANGSASEGAVERESARTDAGSRKARELVRSPGRSVSLAIVVLVVVLGLAPWVPATAEARPPVRGLVYERASSPVLRELRAVLGQKLRLARATPARLRRNRRHRLLIVDGDRLSPSELARRRRAIDRYMDRGGSVLALDVGPGHFARVLDRLTHFDAGATDAGRRSRALLFRDAVVHGRPSVLMLDAPRLTPIGAVRLSGRRRSAATADQAAQVAYLMRARLLRPAIGVRKPRRGEQDVPDYLQHRLWSYSVVGSQAMQQAWWNQDRAQWPVLGVPDQGQQTANWTMNHTWDVYLDNAAGDPGGGFQIVTYNLDGEFSPKKPDEKFAFMYETFGLAGIGGQDKFLARAWWTGAADIRVTPDAATDGKLSVQATAPATPDQTTQYSSGDEFSVGFSASPGEGPGFETSYKVSNVTTHSVPDWGVANQSAGNALAWEFSARNACDIRGPSYSTGACFSLGLGDDQLGQPVLPNELSRSQLELAASGRWRTKQLLADSTTGKLTFSVVNSMQLEDTYCPGWVPLGGCSDHIPDWTSTGPPQQTYTIDASDVVPVGIKSLEVAPNPVDGTANQKAAGTVTLDSPARIPTTVVIFSDIRNAIVGPPTGSGVSRTTVTIDVGKTQATFPILTNANRLPGGGSATAQITAFYGTATTDQLRVTAESGR